MEYLEYRMIYVNRLILGFVALVYGSMYASP